MSKKILSLALVAVMLMSMFAFSASAASGPLTSVGIKVVSDATVGMAAGQDVTVKVYYTVPDGADLSDYLHNASQIILAYTDAYEVKTESPNSSSSYDARVWGASYADYLKEASVVNTKTALFSTLQAKFTEADNAKGWDSAVVVAQNINTENGYTTTTGYALDLDCEIFTFYFKTTREVTADDTIGVPESTVTSGQTKMYYISAAGKNTQYAKNTDTITLAEAVAAPAAATKAPVYEVAKQVRPNGDNIDLGVKAGFDTADIDIAFDNATGTSTNVKTVGATLKVNGEDAGTGTSRFVYKITDTEYQYRVIIENVAKDSTDVYTVELFVEMMDGTIITGDTVEIKAADVVGNLPA